MSNQGYWKYFTAVAIALCLQSSIRAQLKTETSLGNIRERLSSEWSSAVLTRSLESATTIDRIKFSPDGQLLATVGGSQITLWDLNQGEVQRVLPGHFASDIGLEIAPTAIAFSPDGRYVASSTWSQGLLSPDQAIIVRDVATGSEVLSITELDGCRQILFDVSGEIIYGACDFGITAWSFPEGKKLFDFATEYPVEAIALSPNGKVMATVDDRVSEKYLSGEQQGKRNNQIQLWNLESQATLFNTLDGHVNDIAQLEFTADGKRLVSSSYDGNINVWDWQQGTTYRNTDNLHSINGMFSLSANSRLIAGNFHSSAMTNLITGLPLRNVMQLSRGKETSIFVFSPQNQLFARVEPSPNSNHSLIQLWQVENSQSNKLSSKQNHYQTIDITEYWSNQEQPEVLEGAETSTNKPSAIGTDPQAIALSALGLTETVESEQEQVAIEYPQDNLAIVKLTQTNLTDDSVTSIRYLVKFAPYGDKNAEKWQLVWAGKQFKCWSGRGHQDWSSDLCH